VTNQANSNVQTIYVPFRRTRKNSTEANLQIQIALNSVE